MGTGGTIDQCGKGSRGQREREVALHHRHRFHAGDFARDRLVVKLGGGQQHIGVRGYERAVAGVGNVGKEQAPGIVGSVVPAGHDLVEEGAQGEVTVPST